MNHECLIGIPAHLTSAEHANDLIHSIQSIRSQESQFPIYVDINGSPIEFCNIIANQFQADASVNVHIEPVAGRPSSLNRILQFARNHAFDSIIFTNDDLAYDSSQLPFTPLHQTLQTYPLVAAVSKPADPNFQSTPDQHKLSISLVAEHYFYQKMLQERGHHFRGDCFGMRTNFLPEFPQEIAADDLFLAVIYQARHGKNPPIHPDAVVTRFHEVTAHGAIQRIIRSINSRIMLLEFLSNNQTYGPNSQEYQVAANTLNTPDAQSAHARFLKERQNIRNQKGTLVSLYAAGKYEQARELFAPYADACIYWMAVKRLEDTRVVTRSTNGDVTWDRPIN